MKKAEIGDLRAAISYGPAHFGEHHPDLFFYGVHTAEALRECGILWLVFSVLDKAVSSRLTVPWTMWNFSGSVALWLLGMYIETKRK